MATQKKAVTKNAVKKVSTHTKKFAWGCSDSPYIGEDRYDSIEAAMADVVAEAAEGDEVVIYEIVKRFDVQCSVTLKEIK